MISKKIKAFSIAVILASSSFFYANAEVDSVTSELITTLQLIIKRYEEKITNLKVENASLKKETESLKWSCQTTSNNTNNWGAWTSSIWSTWSWSASTWTWLSSIATKTWTWTTWLPNNVLVKASSVEKYNILVNKINSMSWSIFTEYSLSPDSSIWLFEFIEPKNFFISIDDWKNPTWVTAFKKKVLYEYDSSYALKVIWVFELDYKTQYYVTKFWKNPFAWVTRIRVKNPLYKWKLLDEVSGTSSSNASSTSTTTSSSNTTSNQSSNNLSTATMTWEVTLQMIKDAFKKNDVLNALKLSNTYILKDSNNIEVLKIRYRSFYMLWRYSEAMKEIKKLEWLVTWTSLEKTVYCDAKTIAKVLKDNDSYNKYSTLCSQR